MTKVFIDGSAGTTGLRIFDRLRKRDDIQLVTLPDNLRKDVNARAQMLNEVDIAFLCLPDAAAVEAVSLINNDHTVVIDTSTAHRTAQGWTYGFPEITGRQTVAQSKRIANPGCHASGFIAVVAPLIKAGIIKPDAALTCFSLTGYSGGGKKMIAEYESADRSQLLCAPRQYGLSQQHKHLPEMTALTGLVTAPAFCPIVADFYSGMEVTVPLFNTNADEVSKAYSEYYTGKFVHFDSNADESGFLSAAAFSGRDDMQITVNGNSERLLLTARFDNLGKGASGAAIQNMNLVLGVDEAEGLIV